MTPDAIRVRGARQHNLKNIDVDIPRNRLVVLTGVSGSGKSSLAFDTLYAEGQRRYVQSLSAYARQFLDQLEKPDVDFIEGLSPAVAIEQVHSAPNPRSTIATVTEIYDYLRVLYAVAGQPHDPTTGQKLIKNTPAEIGERILSLPEGTRLILLAPVIQSEKGDLRGLFEKLRRQGFIRVRLDGVIQELDDQLKAPRSEEHSVEVVVDRLILREGIRSRLMDSIETALKWNEREIQFLIDRDGREELLTFTTAYANPTTGYILEKLTPQHFSFNTHAGACPACEGVGTVMTPDAALLIPDPSLTIANGAIKGWWTRQPKLKAGYMRSIEALARHFEIGIDVPYKATPIEFKNALLHGTTEAIATGWQLTATKRSLAKPFEGLLPQIQRLHLNAESDTLRGQLTRLMNPQTCTVCEGKRLRPEALGVTLASDHAPAQQNIHDYTTLPIRDALAWMQALSLTEHQRTYVTDLQREVLKRLQFLSDVGLGYLALNRQSGTLSGGETQRIRLATQIGAGLAGVLYVLDEPSIGLHPADNERLIGTLKRLRDLGNTVLVVEHDEAMMKAADHLIELGPGAGPHGGRVIAQGTPSEVCKDSTSLTGAYLDEHNLQNVTVPFRSAVSPASPAPAAAANRRWSMTSSCGPAAAFLQTPKTLQGSTSASPASKGIDKVVVIDQSPIGRSPRSNPATYTGKRSRRSASCLRSSRWPGCVATMPGASASTHPAAAAKNARAMAQIKIDMHFLADVYVTCDPAKAVATVPRRWRSPSKAKPSPTCST
jgi:excinuclease ABC subunit A